MDQPRLATESAHTGCAITNTWNLASSLPRRATLLGPRSVDIGADPGAVWVNRLRADMWGFLYMVTCLVTGMNYLGITLDFRSRMRAHVRDACLSANLRGLRFAIAAFGPDKFQARVLRCAPVLELPGLEVDAIQHFGSLAPAGYNLNRGGTLHMRSGYVFEFAGERAESLAEAAHKFGIAAPVLYYRHANNWTKAQQLGLEPRPHFRGQPVLLPNRTPFLSGRRAAKELGASPWRAQYWRARGASDEQAFGLAPVPAMQGRRQAVVVHGTTYENASVACTKLGIRPRSFSSLLWRWRKDDPDLTANSCLEALFDAEGKRRPTRNEVLLKLPDGREANITQTAFALGISRGALDARRRRKGDQIALGYKADKLRTSVEIAGRTFRSVSDLAKDAGIPRTAVYQRVAKGESLGRAISRPSRKRTPNRLAEGGCAAPERAKTVFT